MEEFDFEAVGILRSPLRHECGPSLPVNRSATQTAHCQVKLRVEEGRHGQILYINCTDWQHIKLSNTRAHIQKKKTIHTQKTWLNSSLSRMSPLRACHRGCNGRSLPCLRASVVVALPCSPIPAAGFARCGGAAAWLPVAHTEGRGASAAAATVIYTGQLVFLRLDAICRKTERHV